MSSSVVTWLLILTAIVLANIPWFFERFLLFMEPERKPVWMCLCEWFILYFLTGFLALGLEKKMQGEIHVQDWEFYAVTFFLFIVFAFPGFIYRYQLRHYLRGAGTRSRSSNG